MRRQRIPETAAGTIVDAGDGHSVYYCVQDDTVKSVATSKRVVAAATLRTKLGSVRVGKIQAGVQAAVTNAIKIAKKMSFAAIAVGGIARTDEERQRRKERRNQGEFDIEFLS